jgi:hypothetical protein
MTRRFRVNRGQGGCWLFVAVVVFLQQLQKGDKLGNRRFCAVMAQAATIVPACELSIELWTGAKRAEIRADRQG